MRISDWSSDVCSSDLVPEGDHRQRFGEARIVREGGDVTIVACGRMVGFSEKVSDKLAGEGIGVDLLDLRTTSPLDAEAILDSVEATGQLVIDAETPPRCRLEERCVGEQGVTSSRSSWWPYYQK